MKDEFITKCTSLYCSLTLKTDVLSNKKITFDSHTTHIKSLWSWVKLLVKKQKSDNQIIAKSSDKYRDFCKELMLNLEINDFNEFQNFILSLLNKYSKRSKMEKTKRLLSFSPKYYKN